MVEDDYDGELRYDRQPVGALQAIDPDRVVYVGTASKSLAPGLRLGWMVLPEPLVAPITLAKELADRQNGVVEQLALAELITSGGLDRHIRRARLRYRRRRDDLIAALAQVPAVRARGIAAGLHAVLDLPADGPSEAEVLAALAADGVAADGLSRYWHRAGPRPSGLVVGFGAPGRAHVPGRPRGAGRHAGALLPLIRVGGAERRASGGRVWVRRLGGLGVLRGEEPVPDPVGQDRVRRRRVTSRSPRPGSGRVAGGR